MAEPSTIARPYAAALFQASTAADGGKLVAQLDALARIADDEGLRQFASDPKVRGDQVFEVVSGIAGADLDAKLRNLLGTVIENGRLPVLPEIGFTGPMRKRTCQAMERFGLHAEYAEEYASLFDEPGAARGAINWYRALPFGSPNGVGPVSVPTLYVYGTKDFALGRKAADLTGEFVKGPYRYEVLEGVSHWMPEEIPSRVSELVLEFIQSV